MSARKLSATLSISGTMKNRPSHRKGGKDRAQNVARRCTTPRYPLVPLRAGSSPLRIGSAGLPI